MPTVKIKNFLIIKEAEFNIKKINVIIGEQATGKSIIAKLIYFLNRFFSEAFIGAFYFIITKEDINIEILKKFSEIFPNYSWHNQEFSIVYHTNIYEIKLINQKNDDKYNFSVEYSEELEKLCTDLIRAIQYVEKVSGKINNLSYRPTDDVIKETTYPFIKKEIEFKYNFKKDSIFIPTARSFFILLENNIFSLLKNNINLDIFMKDFGALWEDAKHNYTVRIKIYNLVDTHFKDIINNNLKSTPLHPSEVIENIVQNILRGKYLRNNNEDYIEHHDGSKIRLKDASSSQQEALPMLMILSNLLTLEENKEKSTMVFIEEPEAHLFPKSQKAMISLIATIANARECPFVLTTHSPYILSAINNLIVGADAFEKIKDNPNKIAELEEFIPQSEMVRFEEVSAYTIEDGKLISIMNDDNRLIDANIIDDVSNEFADAFDKACEFIYRDK